MGYVLWSDESNYKYHFPEQKFVWRKDGEGLKPENLKGLLKKTERLKWCGGVFVWGYGAFTSCVRWDHRCTVQGHSVALHDS